MDELTPAQIQGRLTAALATITSLWDDMLELPGVSRSSGTVEYTRPEAVASLRREIHHELKVWCDLIRSHFPHTDPPPSGIHQMCDHLTRHAHQLADAGQRALDGLEDSAEALTRFVYGTKKPPVALGPCPLNDCDGGTIRATNHKDEEGRPLQRCDTCHEQHTTDEWLTLTGTTRPTSLSADQVITLAHQQFGIRITRHAIVCLTKRGTLKQSDDGTYPIGLIVEYLTRRAQLIPA